MHIITFAESNRIMWIVHQLLGFIFICLAAMRLYIIQYRIIQKNIRITMCVICYLVICGLSISIFSYVIPDNGWMLRYFRYLILAIELASAMAEMMLITFIGRPKISLKQQKLRLSGNYILAALIVFVLTNDLHQQVFEYSYRKDELLFNYTWGGNLLVIIIAIMKLVAAVILCVRTIRNQNLFGTIWMGIFIAVGLLYLAVQYFSYWDHMIHTEFLAWQSDRGLFLGILSLLFVDLAIQSRLIPTNRNYVALFDNSQLKLLITDKQYNYCFQSQDIRTLEPDFLKEITDKSPEPYPMDEYQFVYSAEIPNGYVFYVQDVRELRKLQKETGETVSKLKKLNEILALENNRKRSGAKDKISSELMKGLNQHISSKTDMLSAMVKELNELKKQENNETQRWQLLARIVLLLVDIKRHCILYFLGRQNPTMPAEELVVYLDELAEFAGLANIRCLTTNRIKGQIKVDYAVCFYEFFYLVINMASLKENVILIEELEAGKEAVEMHILISFEAPDLNSYIKDVYDYVNSSFGTIQYKELEDVNDISLRIPLEGSRI